MTTNEKLNTLMHRTIFSNVVSKESLKEIGLSVDEIPAYFEVVETEEQKKKLDTAYLAAQEKAEYHGDNKSHWDVLVKGKHGGHGHEISIIRSNNNWAIKSYGWPNANKKIISDKNGNTFGGMNKRIFHIVLRECQKDANEMNKKEGFSETAKIRYSKREQVRINKEISQIVNEQRKIILNEVTP
jgi:hypothetical protein